MQQFTYHGAMPTGWRLNQGNDGLLTLEIDWDFEDEDTTTAAGTPTYPAAQSPFNWSQAVVTYNSAQLDCKDFSFAADLMMKTDRRYLRGSSLQEEARTHGRPRIHRHHDPRLRRHHRVRALQGRGPSLHSR